MDPLITLGPLRITQDNPSIRGQLVSNLHSIFNFTFFNSNSPNIFTGSGHRDTDIFEGPLFCLPHSPKKIFKNQRRDYKPTEGEEELGKEREKKKINGLGMMTTL